MRSLSRSIVLCTLLLAAGSDAADIPIAPGTTVVLAVSNAPGQRPGDLDAAQGDYETVVTVSRNDSSGLFHDAYIDAVDGHGVRRQVTIPRQVLPQDLQSSRVQVFGFMSDDPLVVAGTTSLGLSQTQVRELTTSGTTRYSFENYVGRGKVEGVLKSMGRVKFPVLINGQRVELDALRATAQLPAGDTTRPFEQIILEHAAMPLSLRIAYGPRGGNFPFKPDFAREVVRIEWLVPNTLEVELTKNCRVEVPGIYFDFNEATLKPSSKPALDDMANTIRKHGEWHLSIEGHTDNIGGERYNDALSMRRATAVKEALRQQASLDVKAIAIKGWGLHRPIETNDTLAGRARNRRVELVRDCGQR